MSNINLQYTLKDGTTFSLENKIPELTEEKAKEIFTVKLKKQFGKGLTPEEDLIISNFVKDHLPSIIIKKNKQVLELELESFEIDQLRNFIQTILLQYTLDATTSFDQLIGRYGDFASLPESIKTEILNNILNNNASTSVNN